MGTVDAPDLVMIDVGAPLEECLRRLQSQLARVEFLAAQEQTASHRGGAPPSSFIAGLLQDYAGTATTGTLRDSFEDGSVTALRRRVAQKLRRLSEDQHLNLCNARCSLDNAEADAVMRFVESTTTETPPAPTSKAARAQSGPHEAPDEEDDLFGWVTETAAAPAQAPPPPPPSPPATAPNVDTILRRVAEDIADVVEARYRHSGQLEDVHQQLLQLQQHAVDLLGLSEGNTLNDEEKKKGSSATVSMPSSLRYADVVRDILAYHPSHAIASEQERGVWQQAWQSVLPATSTEASTLKIGDAIEMIDVAVLAHVNAQRYAALQRRWCAVQNDHVGLVQQLNRRLAQAALQLEEMERHS
jgi:hypothetical protein